MTFYIRNDGKPFQKMGKMGSFERAWLALPNKGHALWLRQDGSVIREYSGTGRPTEHWRVNLKQVYAPGALVIYDPDLLVDEGL